MIRLARLSIRRPRAALTFWAIFAVVLSLIGLGVSDSLSPSISVVPGSESSRAQTLAEVRVRPVRARADPPRGAGGPARPPGSRSSSSRSSKRGDTRVMSAWSTRRVRPGAAPAPDAAMIVASVATHASTQMVDDGPAADRAHRRPACSPATSRRTITGQPTLDRALKDEAIATTRQAELIAVGGPLRAAADRPARARSPRSSLAGFGAVTTLTGFGAMALLGQGHRDRPARGRARRRSPGSRSASASR